jgi:hypothetical protein
MTIFKIKKDSEGLVLEDIKGNSAAKEKNIEEIIFESLVKGQEGGNEIISKIFGEGAIFPINRQQKYKTKKISDILAIDNEGRIIVMELKKDAGKAGVEMQALQYLVQIKSYPTGLRFFTDSDIKHQKTLENIKDFFGEDEEVVEKINKEQRIILIAREFDESLFSMGEWLSEKGVGFTCISYDFYKIGEDEFVSFSTKFDSKPYNSYQLGGNKNIATNTTVPYYYHNSGCSKEEVVYLIENGFIGCGFDGRKFDKGYAILNNKYNKNDKIFLYQNGIGIMAVGKVKEGKEIDKDDENYYLNKGYSLLENQGLELDSIKVHPHRLKVDWEVFTTNPQNAFSREKMKELKKQNKDLLLPITQTSSIVSRSEDVAQNFYETVKKFLSNQN